MRNPYDKYHHQQQDFVKYLKTFQRPQNYEEVYSVVKDKVSGLYRNESEPIWEIFKDKEIKTFVEVGRNLGGSLFFFTCLFKDLQEVLSIDIANYPLTDNALMDYFKRFEIKYNFVECDSITFKTNRMWDFAFIDGGHTGPIVKRDIEIWKDRCKYIGFHDYADKGRKNKHKKVFEDVVQEIKSAWDENGWKQIGKRGRSEIIFETGNLEVK